MFVFFGCGQKNVDDVTSIDVNTTTTEKGNIDNLEVTTNFNEDVTQKVDIETSVVENEYTTETTTNDNNKIESTISVQTTNGTETTKISELNDGQTTMQSIETTTVDKTTTNAVETTESTNKTIFTVIFKGYDGKVLKTEKVKKGEDATAPNPPEIKGFLFVKWDTYYKDVKTDITVNAVYKEITKPTLIVDTVKTNDKEVVVKVSAVNNPGLLALLLKINYDESALTLKKVENGSTMTEYTFTGPKNLKSGCNAAWNIIEVPENVVDGEVVLLHFEVNKDALIGSHNISVTCFDGAFNSDYETVDFDIINGSIII